MDVISYNILIPIVVTEADMIVRKCTTAFVNNDRLGAIGGVRGISISKREPFMEQSALLAIGSVK